jgi:hypothetical protein
VLATAANVPTWHWVLGLVVISLISYSYWLIGAERGESRLERLVVVLLLPLMITPLIIALSTNRPSRELIKRARIEPRKGHAVKLTVLKENQPIGHDEGLVFLAGDQMIYEGLLTSFHITTADVDAPLDQFATGPLLSSRSEQWNYGNLSSDSAWGFALKARPEYRVYFFPLRLIGHDSIYRPLFRWLKLPACKQTGPLLPPLESQPGLPRTDAKV